MADVLVVDDIAENRELVTTLLHYAGHTSRQASNGEEALQQVAQRTPDLVVCDILMPGMDGYEFVRLLRSNEATASIRVVFYTATFLEREALALARSCGVRHVLTKPCEPEQVLQTIEAVLAEPPADHAMPGATEEFDRTHLQIVTDKLAQKVYELQELNGQVSRQLEQLRAQTLERERAEMLLRLEHAVSLALANAGEAYDGVTAVLGIVCETLSWQFGRYWQVDEAAGTLRFATQWCAPGTMAATVAEESHGQVLRKGEGLAGAVWQTGVPLWSEDLRSDARVAQRSLLRHGYFGSACLFPVVAGPDILGVLSFLHPQAHMHDERLDVLGRAVGHQIGQFLRRQQAEQALRLSERFHRMTLDSLLEQIAVLDGSGRVLSVNRAWRDFMREHGHTVLHLPEGANYLAAQAPSGNATWTDRADEAGAAHLRGAIRTVLDQRELVPAQECSCTTATGRHWFLGRISRFAEDGALRIVLALENITERVQAEHRAARLHRVSEVQGDISSLIMRVTAPEELFREACRIAVETGRLHQAWVMVMDLQTRAISVAAAHGDDPDTSYLGLVHGHLQASFETGDFRFEQVIGQRKPLIENDVAASGWMALREAALASGARSLVALPLVVNGETAAVLVLYANEPGFFTEQEMKLLTELANDMAFALGHLAQAEQLNRLAYYDALTGDANAMLFNERLAQAIASAAAGQRRLALAVVGIDRFKSFSDTFGRHAGDALLRLTSERIAQAAGDRQRMARVGPDQFGVLLENPPEEIELIRRLGELHASCFDAPFPIDGKPMRVSAHIGVALYPADGTGVELLYRNAEAAVRRAEAMKERILFYDAQMTEAVAEKLALELRLRAALQGNEFLLLYQPKVDCRTREIVGAEALIRWNNPELGLVSPARFIPLMEETGLIREVGGWILRRALQDRREWAARGLAPPRIAINLSPIQLRARDFIQGVEAALAAEAVGDAGLDVEITESALVDDISETIERLQALRRHGMEIAIDDFGTGYSSLAYLARLPVQVLKIDQAFVGAMLSDASARTLVTTMVSLAHALGLKVVAEGVETQAQAALLEELGCDQLQGYLIARPLRFEDWVPLLELCGS